MAEPITPITPVQSLTPKLPRKDELSKGGGLTTMDWPEAQRAVMNGKSIKRLEWSPAPDYGLLKDGWLEIFTKGKFHVWKVNDGDIEAKDWVVVVEKN